jgi:hypothetical protein
MRDQYGARAIARRCGRRLATSMTSANDYNVAMDHLFGSSIAPTPLSITFTKDSKMKLLVSRETG